MIVFLYISEMFATRVASLLAVFDWRGTQKHRPRSSTVEFLTTRPYGGRWSSRGPEVRVRFPPWSIRRCRFKSCRGQTFCNFCVGIKTSGGLHASEKLKKKKQIVPIFSTAIRIETKFFPSQFHLEYITAQFGRLKTPCWCGWRRVMLKTMIMTPQIQWRGPHTSSLCNSWPLKGHVGWTHIEPNDSRGRIYPVPVSSRVNKGRGGD